MSELFSVHYVLRCTKLKIQISIHHGNQNHTTVFNQLVLGGGGGLISFSLITSQFFLCPPCFLILQRDLGKYEPHLSPNFSSLSCCKSDWGEVKSFQIRKHCHNTPSILTW